MAEQKGTYLEEYLESVVLLPSEIKRVRPTTTHATHHVASLFSTRLYRELRVRAEDREQWHLGKEYNGLCLRCRGICLTSARHACSTLYKHALSPSRYRDSRSAPRTSRFTLHAPRTRSSRSPLSLPRTQLSLSPLPASSLTPTDAALALPFQLSHTHRLSRPHTPLRTLTSCASWTRTRRCSWRGSRICRRSTSSAPRES